MRKFRRPILLLAGALVSAAPASAAHAPHPIAGAIEGRVLSTEGVGLPAATVVVSLGQREVTRASTDAEGRFRCGHLPPADRYVLRVDSMGYRSPRVGPVEVPPGGTIHLDVTIGAPAFGQSAERPPEQTLDAGTTHTSSRFDAGFFEGLPIIGHDYQDALTLAPGVTDPDGDGSPNVHGARQTGLQYRLDGGDVTDPVSGAAGINLNPLVLEEIEIITAGAPASFGRAMGGFTNIATRSGGNDLEWRLAFFWQGRFLNGGGAGNDDVVSFDEEPVAWRDIRAAGRLGGAIVKDKLWYFAALESLNGQQPSDQIGSGLLIESRGTYYFGKLTWQSNPANRLEVQVAGDPRQTQGLGLSTLTSGDSGYDFDRRGLSAQFGWTASLSPDMSLQAALTRFESDLVVEPTSPLFEPVETVILAAPFTGGRGLSARYPCSVPNCSTTFGERRIYQVDAFTSRVSGPYFYSSDDSRTRDALRADLAYAVLRGPGEQHVKGGFELAEEQSRQEVIINPVLFDVTYPYFSPSSLNQVSGYQVLQAAQPGRLVQQVADFTTGIYVMDTFKPRSNIAIVAGLRLDREDLDATGFEAFDPRAERRQSIKLWSAVCAEAVRQDVAFPMSNCSPTRPYNGAPPVGVGSLRSFLDQNMDGINDVPALVAELDLNQDGFVSLSGQEGVQLFRYFTTLANRQALNFEVEDTHLSPRFGISWDPWDDGKTRLFAHWGRYYDRLRSETVRPDGGPTFLSFAFLPGQSSHQIAPGAASSGAAYPSISQVNHELRAPHTDELSVGFERGLGAWAVGATYIRRKARDLLQDTDVNHYTCAQAGSVIGIDPSVICGDAGTLEKDRFGFIIPDGSGGFSSLPNGVEDLYGASSAFNSVLRVDNGNDSDYVACEIKAVRALHRNWQMQASYTWSRARGQASELLSSIGDDPSNLAEEEGYLDYDQRHRIKLEAVTLLSHGVSLGGVITWASGTPYSVIYTLAGDLDSNNNALARTLYPTGRRNDQRNGSSWLLDGRIEKSFRIARVNTGGFLTVENLLNSDTLVISSISADGTRLAATKDFGRRFEIGAIFGF